MKDDDELKDLEEEKAALDSDPRAPGNQIPNPYEQQEKRAARERGNIQLTRVLLVILFLLGLFSVAICNHIVGS